MADLVTSQVYDGARNVILNLNSISDGTGQVNYPILDLTALEPDPETHLVLTRCNYDIKGGSVDINFGNMILQLSNIGERKSGRKFNNWGGVKGVPGTNAITLTTHGFAVNSGYSITLEFKKGGGQNIKAITSVIKTQSKNPVKTTSGNTVRV